jgi:hypothetical protein
MADSLWKQTALTSRASYQLREIEAACRQVTVFSRQLNTFSVEVGASEVNCRKVEMLKGDIRDKLREYSSSIDAICQLLDRKIQLILAELKRVDSRSSPHPSCDKCQNTTANAFVSHIDD